MAATPKVFLFLFVVLYGSDVHGRRNGCTAGGVYDVTEYGAGPSSRDNKGAFLAAWRAACGSAAGNATVLIPEGTFAVSAVEFSGPCKNGDAPVVVVIDGVLQPCLGSSCRLSGDAWITFSALNHLLVTGAGALDGRGGAKSNEPKTTTLEFDGVANTTVRGLRFVDSRGSHVNFHRSSRVAAEGLHIHAPAPSRNTDGIHVGFSSHVSISNSVIGTGDDCVSVGPGSTDIVVIGVICGPGHGISVGSLGREEGEEEVRGLVIKNCTVRGTTNGLRIKTWPGSPPGRASNITFEDITMANVSNPIIIDQHYCPHAHCPDIDKPSLVQISDVTFKRIEGTSNSVVAVQLRCSEERPCSGVHLDGINLKCGGDQPCHTQFTNVRGRTPSSEAQAPSLGVPIQEEDDHIASSTEQLIGQ